MGVRGGGHSLADIPQSTEQVPRRRIVVRHIDKQTQCLGANLGAITVFVSTPEPSYIHAQAIIILRCRQFSPARPVPLAEVHAPSDRLACGTPFFRVSGLTPGFSALPAHPHTLREALAVYRWPTPARTELNPRRLTLLATSRVLGAKTKFTTPPPALPLGSTSSVCFLSEPGFSRFAQEPISFSGALLCCVVRIPPYRATRPAARTASPRPVAPRGRMASPDMLGRRARATAPPTWINHAQRTSQ